MKKFLFIATLLTPTLVMAQLEWRVSVKLFTGPGNALPQIPCFQVGANCWNNAADIYQRISNNVGWANQILDSTGRGYRWRLVEIVTVPGTTAPLPASTNSWYNLPVGAGTQDDLDAKARTNAAGFQFRTDAINFYLVNSQTGPNGGYCSFPTESQDVILIAPNSFLDVLIHESGHFFGLSHTFDTEAYQLGNGSPCTNGCACPRLVGGDDGIADTPLDHQCWNQNNVATNTYGRLYAQLNAAEQYFVDNTWSNIMSYHSPGNRFTSDQLDRMTDASNGARQNVASGRTWFVDLNSSCLNPSGSSFCVLAFGGPFATVTAGVNAANNGDIVLIRAGSYDEVRSYNKPVTLRATRGEARIGPP